MQVGITVEVQLTDHRVAQHGILNDMLKGRVRLHRGSVY